MKLSKTVKNIVCAFLLLVGTYLSFYAALCYIDETSANYTADYFGLVFTLGLAIPGAICIFFGTLLFKHKRDLFIIYGFLFLFVLTFSYLRRVELNQEFFFFDFFYLVMGIGGVLLGGRLIRFWFLDFIFLMMFILYFPVLCLKGKWHRGMWARLGFLPQELGQRLTHPANIWIHAVSVGEIQAVANIVSKIQEAFPSYQMICSTVTKTGFQLARERFPQSVQVIYAPLDFSGVVRKFIRVIKPQIYISTETEIWPNIFNFLTAKNIPIVIINGRISDQSFRGYRWIRFFVKAVLKNVRAFCMQSEEDAKRIIHLGAQPQRVNIVGNIKFDSYPQAAAISLRELGYNQEDWLWIAGSTHPGEEEMCLNIYQQLKQQFLQLRLVLVPRHIERSRDVERIVLKQQLKPVMMASAHNERMDAECVLIGDKIGQLAGLYSLAKIVFIGKTFCIGGGQNMLEPAFFGKPVFVGPLTQNFRDVMRILKQEEAIIQVDTPAELQKKMEMYLRTPEDLKRIGVCAAKAVEKYRGATEKTVQIIKKALDGDL